MLYKKLQSFEYNILKKYNWSNYYSKEGILIVQFDDDKQTIGINNRRLFGAAVSNLVAEKGMDEDGNINRIGEELEMAYDIFLASEECH